MEQNCTDFISVQNIETMFAFTVGFSGSVNSNTGLLTKILKGAKGIAIAPNVQYELLARRQTVSCFNAFTVIAFLPRCMECRRGLAMRFLSVRPSVRLSVKRVHCDKTEKSYV